MAYDNHANYAKIGLAVVLGTLAILATLVYIAGIGDNSDELIVETYFNDPVDGLSVGSAVNFRGVKVGEVCEIGFITAAYPEATDIADLQRIRVLLALDLRRFGCSEPSLVKEILRERVDRGLRAMVSSSGVTGLSRIELGTPHTPVPVEQLAWRPMHPLIPPAPSLMSTLSDALRTAVDHFNKMDIVAVWSNVATVAESSVRIAEGANRLVESQRGGIGSIVRNVDDASHSVRELSERLKEDPSLILRRGDPQPLPETAR